MKSGNQKNFAKVGKDIYEFAGKIVGCGHRYPGSEGEKKASKLLMETLKEAGVEKLTFEPYKLKCYKVNSQSVSFIFNDENIEMEAFPIWYTPAATLTAEILPVDLGLDDSWKKDATGKIVFARSTVCMNFLPLHNLTDMYLQAEEAGAAGFMAYVNMPCGIVSRYDELFEDEPSGSIPGILVEQSDGIFLESIVKESIDPIMVTIESDVEEFEDEAGDIFGIIPGTEEMIILETHYDSVYDGAVDNAGGNAIWVALAKAALDMPQPHPTIVLSGNTAHENTVGARHYIERHKDIVNKAYAIMNVDGAGSIGYVWNESSMMPTGEDEIRIIHTSNNVALTKIAMKAVKEYSLLPSMIAPLSHMHANIDLEEAFADEGIPMVLTIGKPIGYHSMEDTMDKMTPEQLGRSYCAHVKMLEDILKASPDELFATNNLPYDEYVDALIDCEVNDSEKSEYLTGALFDVVPGTAKTGQQIQCSVSNIYSPDSIVADIKWDFGDGFITHGPIGIHEYSQSGKYTIKLSWFDEYGRRAHAKKTIWIR